MATKAETNARDPGRPDEDYKDASGRDHPAESEHDHGAESERGHARQKLNGESARVVRRAGEGAGADKTAPPRKT